jgi:hypothetical protein
MPIISNWFQKLPQNIPYGMFRFQFIPSYGESLYKFEQVATGAPTENIYISAGSTPTTFHLIIVFYVGSQEYSSSWLNLVLSSWRKLNWRIRPARRLCAGFRKFSKKNSCIARARRGRACLTVYPPRIQIADVATPRTQPDHRKSKFGLR